MSTEANQSKYFKKTLSDTFNNGKHIGNLADLADDNYIYIKNIIHQLFNEYGKKNIHCLSLEKLFRNMYFYLPYFGTKKSFMMKKTEGLEIMLRLEICSIFLTGIKDCANNSETYPHLLLPEPLFEALSRLRPELYDEDYFHMLVHRSYKNIN